MTVDGCDEMSCYVRFGWTNENCSVSIWFIQNRVGDHWWVFTWLIIMLSIGEYYWVRRWLCTDEYCWVVLCYNYILYWVIIICCAELWWGIWFEEELLVMIYCIYIVVAFHASRMSEADVWTSVHR